MEPCDLNRMFDALAPTREQEQAVLDRLLQTERKDRPMKKLKKITVFAVAAALMVISCAAAVVTGIDQRILDYFGADREQAELLVPGAVPVDVTVEDNGAALHVTQVLMDRYTIMVLLDFTVPDGVEMDEVIGFDSYGDSHFLDSNSAEVSPGAGGVRWICVEKDAETRRITFMYSHGLAETGTNDKDRFRLKVHNLKGSRGQILLPGDWSCVIPVPGDSGLYTAMDEVYWTEGAEERITEVYLSPMTFHITLERNVPLDGGMDDWSVWNGPDLTHFAWLQENIILADKNGEPVVLTNKNCRGDPQKTTFTFGFEEIIDPARFQGGTLTIFGYEISLDNLVPAK